jgi:hypothetical protein
VKKKGTDDKNKEMSPTSVLHPLRKKRRKRESMLQNFINGKKVIFQRRNCSYETMVIKNEI